MILRLTMYLLLSYGIISFVEHIIHRYFMHMKWLPAAVYRAYPFFNTTYEAHAVRHHGRWYKRFDYEPDPFGRFDNLTFTLSDSLAMLISALPLWAPLIFLSPFGGCVFIASAVVHNRLWNALHRQMHVPEDVFFKDWKVYRFLARYHFMHHQMNGRNFNVVCPLADFVLCRTAKPRVRDIRNMLTLGLLYPRTIRMRSRVAGWSTRRFAAHVPMNLNSEALPTVDPARIIHDGSSRNRAVAWRDGHAEPRSPEAYLNSTSRERVASLPAEGSSQQRIRDCSRSVHE